MWNSVVKFSIKEYSNNLHRYIAAVCLCTLLASKAYSMVSYLLNFKIHLSWQQLKKEFLEDFPVKLAL
jgi:hypothetical protein